MPRDDTHAGRGAAAPWLDPALIRSLAERVAAARLAGARVRVIEQTCFAQARAMRPAWPEPWVAEAASVALWVGGADGA